MLTQIAAVTVIALTMIGVPIVLWSLGQQRQLRASRPRHATGDTMNGITRQDLINAIRAVARLQAAHDATRDRIGGLQQERDDLKDELAWLLGELAVRPEPHPVVRFLHAHGPDTTAGLRRHLGPVEPDELRALIDSHQIVALDQRPGLTACRYQFVPHHQRRTTNPNLTPLNRYLALLVTTPTTSDRPADPLTAADQAAAALPPADERPEVA